MTLLIVLVIGALAFVMFTYNILVKMNNQVKEGWADIDVQLKRRYNLIPNIVESVKGYAAHEEGVFVKVTEARASAINASNIKEQSSAENMLSGALKSLFAVAENYPQLKANENFLQLQNELVDTEDKIQSARRFYNSIVRDFNTKVQQFPSSVVAQVFSFKAKEFFELNDEEQRKNVEVSFAKKEEAPTPTPISETPAPAPVTPEAPAPEMTPSETVETPEPMPIPETPEAPASTPETSAPTESEAPQADAETPAPEEEKKD